MCMHGSIYIGSPNHVGQLPKLRLKGRSSWFAKFFHFVLISGWSNNATGLNQLAIKANKNLNLVEDHTI